jgi:hypothetical protein
MSVILTVYSAKDSHQCLVASKNNAAGRYEDTAHMRRFIFYRGRRMENVPCSQPYLPSGASELRWHFMQAVLTQTQILYIYIPQCVRDNNVACYKQLLHRWIDSIDLGFKRLSHFIENKLYDVPYGQMYITMALIKHLNGDVSRDCNIAVDVLRPQSESDAHEIALWVQNLLQRIHAEVRQIDLEVD